MIGLYLHVPFCQSKCPYCDFYSIELNERFMYIPNYLKAMQQEMQRFANAHSMRLNHTIIDTIYFGGGTPSLLGASGIASLLQAAYRCFPICTDAEITCEVNPGDGNASFFRDLRLAGINRLSFGVQSADEQELLRLERRHTLHDAEQSISMAQRVGCNNISIDLMLALPDSDVHTLLGSAEWALGQNIQHVSAYLLKVEAGTRFYQNYSLLNLPDEDETVEQYNRLCQFLTSGGLQQYEISNFARPGFQSRHNLHYWRCEPYLGFGPSAHSFFENRRFYYKPDLFSFLDDPLCIEDGSGGHFEEFAMLSLRLSEGISLESCVARFPDGAELFHELLARASRLPKSHVCTNEKAIRLTQTGFAVSNYLIATLLG